MMAVSSGGGKYSTGKKAPMKKGGNPFQKKNGGNAGEDYPVNPCTTACLKKGGTKAQCQKKCA